MKTAKIKLQYKLREKFMISFVKKFKDILNVELQLVIVIIIAIYTLAFRVAYIGGFFAALTSLLPILLIVCSSVLLVFFKKPLAGHAVLLLGLFIDGLTNFIGALFNLSFGPFVYAPGFTPQLFVNLIIFIYLTLIVISYLMAGGVSTNPLKGKTFMLGVLLFVFVWLLQGFYIAVTALALPLIALFIGLEFPALILMLAIVIDEPFIFINDAINLSLGSSDLTYYFYMIGAVFFIYLLGVEVYKAIRSKNYKS